MINIRIDAKSYDQTPLFERFEIELRTGELLCLVGPSGCGKTTLLNMIAGLDSHFSGALIKADNSHTPTIGYMFQQPRLLPWRTLRQNLQLVVGPEQYPRIEPLLEQMGLLAYIDSYPNRLSLGMARRVALARCLLIDPDLILMDEPFVSLDPPTAEEMRQRVQSLRQQRPGSGIVLVTHDLREAVQLADRILVLGGSPTRILHEWQAEQPSQQRSRDYIEQQEQRLLAHYPHAGSRSALTPLNQCHSDTAKYQCSSDQQAST